MMRKLIIDLSRKEVNQFHKDFKQIGAMSFEGYSEFEETNVNIVDAIILSEKFYSDQVYRKKCIEIIIKSELKCDSVYFSFHKGTQKQFTNCKSDLLEALNVVNYSVHSSDQNKSKLYHDVQKIEDHFGKERYKEILDAYISEYPPPNYSTALKILHKFWNSKILDDNEIKNLRLYLKPEEKNLDSLIEDPELIKLRDFLTDKNNYL